MSQKIIMKYDRLAIPTQGLSVRTNNNKESINQLDEDFSQRYAI